MQRGIVLTDPIYDRMITELYTGNYARSSSLPTLEELCAFFQVGRNTMRMVLSRLAENGYIRSCRGRAAEVVFDLQNPGHRAQYMRDLLLRREAILDVFDTLALLLPAVLGPCLHACPEEELSVLSRRAAGFLAEPAEDALFSFSDMLIQLYGEFFSSLGNPYIADLFTSLMQYTKCFSMAAYSYGMQYDELRAASQGLLRQLLDFASRRDAAGFCRIVTQYLRAMRRYAEDFFARISAVVPAPEASSAFFWAMEPRQEYLYAQVITGVLRGIHTGRYLPGSLLPSYTSLAQLYGVSGKTAEKAIGILNGYHIVKTQNGVGTKVAACTIRSAERSIKNPTLQKNLYICLMGLQMAGIFSKTAAPHALFYLTPEQIRKLRAEMDSHPRFAIEPLLDIFFECIPSKTLHAIYDQLKNSMAWGVCLEPYFVREKDRLSQTKKAAQKLLADLELPAADPDVIRRDIDSLDRPLFDFVRDTLARYIPEVANLRLP